MQNNIWIAEIQHSPVLNCALAASITPDHRPIDPYIRPRGPLRIMVERHYIEALLRTLYTTRKES